MINKLVIFFLMFFLSLSYAQNSDKRIKECPDIKNLKLSEYSWEENVIPILFSKIYLASGEATIDDNTWYYYAGPIESTSAKEAILKVESLAMTMGKGKLGHDVFTEIDFCNYKVSPEGPYITIMKEDLYL